MEARLSASKEQWSGRQHPCASLYETILLLAGNQPSRIAKRIVDADSKRNPLMLEIVTTSNPTSQNHAVADYRVSTFRPSFPSSTTAPHGGPLCAEQHPYASLYEPILLLSSSHCKGTTKTPNPRVPIMPITKSTLSPSETERKVSVNKVPVPLPAPTDLLQVLSPKKRTERTESESTPCTPQKKARRDPPQDTLPTSVSPRKSLPLKKRPIPVPVSPNPILGKVDQDLVHPLAPTARGMESNVVTGSGTSVLATSISRDSNCPILCSDEDVDDEQCIDYSSDDSAPESAHRTKRFEDHGGDYPSDSDEADHSCGDNECCTDNATNPKQRKDDTDDLFEVEKETNITDDNAYERCVRFIKGQKDKYSKRWMEMFQRLVLYKEKHKTTRVPQRYEADPQLGAWVQTQRRYCKKKERVELLNAIGFVWDADRSWIEMYLRLVAYKEKHNSICVPQNYEADPQLGYWVHNQRRYCKKKERIDLLNAIGYVWDAEGAWMKMYQRLVEYKEKYKTTRVPQTYKADPQLGRWVATQRQRCKKKERADLLNDIGFVWNVNKSNRS